MIHINLEIRNPWGDHYKPRICRDGKVPLTKHKFWEASISTSSVILAASVTWTVRTDHAGLRVNLSLLMLELEFHIFDHRHWDEVVDRWAERSGDDCGN